MRHTRDVPIELPDTEPPTEVELDRASSLTLHWADGSVTRYALDDLRRNCPCAECRGVRDQGRIPGPGPNALVPLTAIDAKLVGGWGLMIHWSDGHETGIYAWSILRTWADLDAQ
jgi:DUF971 family protein